MENVSIRRMTKDDLPEITKIFEEYWGAPYMVSFGRVNRAEDLEGYIASRNSVIIGLITFRVDDHECELISLNSFQERKGLGSELVKKVVTFAQMNNIRRIFLCTTNDNTDALMYYQRRGFTLKALYNNKMEEYRKLKPEIPEIGRNKIPIRDEIEMELIF